jgi:hypothetical protein
VGAATLGVASVGSASAQDTAYTVQAVVSDAEEFAEDYLGLFVHVGPEGSAQLDASEVDSCSFESWNPEELTVHNGRLIDQGDEDMRDVPTKVYVSSEATIEQGTLFVVNRQYECSGAYVGLELEQVGAALGLTETPGDGNADAGTGSTGESSQGSGPGFGVLAGAAGVVGGLLALARRGSDSDGQ